MSLTYPAPAREGGLMDRSDDPFLLTDAEAREAEDAVGATLGSVWRLKGDAAYEAHEADPAVLRCRAGRVSEEEGGGITLSCGCQVHHAVNNFGFRDEASLCPEGARLHQRIRGCRNNSERFWQDLWKHFSTHDPRTKNAGGQR